VGQDREEDRTLIVMTSTLTLTLALTLLRDTVVNWLSFCGCKELFRYNGSSMKKVLPDPSPSEKAPI
jgi:hypothetical protein